MIGLTEVLDGLRRRRTRGVAGDLHRRRPDGSDPARVRVPRRRRLGSPGDRGARPLPPGPLARGHRRTTARRRARGRGGATSPAYEDELIALRTMVEQRGGRRRGRGHRARDASGDLRVARGQRRRAAGPGRRPADREAGADVPDAGRRRRRSRHVDRHGRAGFSTRPLDSTGCRPTRHGPSRAPWSRRSSWPPTAVPVSFDHDGSGALTSQRGAGGLVTALSGVFFRDDTTWVAAAMSGRRSRGRARGLRDRPGIASTRALRGHPARALRRLLQPDVQPHPLVPASLPLGHRADPDVRRDDRGDVAGVRGGEPRVRGRARGGGRPRSGLPDPGLPPGARPRPCCASSVRMRASSISRTRRSRARRTSASFRRTCATRSCAAWPVPTWSVSKPGRGSRASSCRREASRAAASCAADAS